MSATVNAESWLRLVAALGTAQPRARFCAASRVFELAPDAVGVPLAGVADELLPDAGWPEAVPEPAGRWVEVCVDAWGDAWVERCVAVEDAVAPHAVSPSTASTPTAAALAAVALVAVALVAVALVTPVLVAFAARTGRRPAPEFI